MKIFITGGNSFLGKNLLPLLDNIEYIKYWAPSSKTIDITSLEATSKAIQEYNPDCIVHLAALCGGIKKNKKMPGQMVSINTRMALNIYDASIQKSFLMKENIPQNRVSSLKIYSLGSVCAYPVNCQIPFKEDDILKGAAEKTNEPYGNSKRLLMTLSETYRQEYGIGGAFLIPVNMYGKADHFDLEDSHVIPALINKFVTAVKNKEDKVYCWGTGTASREFLYAADCAQAIVKAITSGLDTKFPINLGTGQEITIKDLSILIGELTGFQGEIIFTGEVSDGQPRRCLDVSRAKKLLDWEAKTKLREGLIETINWYKENYETHM
jgi:GDP-L-fucose synthase